MLEVSGLLLPPSWPPLTTHTQRKNIYNIWSSHNGITFACLRPGMWNRRYWNSAQLVFAAPGVCIKGEAWLREAPSSCEHWIHSPCSPCSRFGDKLFFQPETVRGLARSKCIEDNCSYPNWTKLHWCTCNVKLVTSGGKRTPERLCKKCMQFDETLTDTVCPAASTSKHGKSARGNLQWLLLISGLCLSTANCLLWADWLIFHQTEIVLMYQISWFLTQGIDAAGMQTKCCLASNKSYGIRKKIKLWTQHCSILYL